MNDKYAKRNVKRLRSPGTLIISRTAPPSTARFYLDNGMLGTYTFQVTYTPAANATLSWSITSTLTPWTTAYNNEYDDTPREAKSLSIGKTIDGYLTAWNGSSKDDMNGDKDYYIIKANKPGNYTVMITSIPSTITGELTLYDKDQNQIIQTSGNTNRKTYTPTEKILATEDKTYKPNQQNELWVDKL